MSVNTLILKLDDAANTAAYNEALLYFESLGFKGKTASDLAIERVHNNVLFDAGTLPEINVIAKAWGDGDDASRRENYQKTLKTKREEKTKKQLSEFNQNIRNATDKWGNAIGTGVEIASGFTPLWWVSPAVRTGLDLSKGNYKEAALNAGLAFAAPYAVSKGIQYISPYAKSAILAGKLNRLIRNTKLYKPLEELNLLDGYLFHNGHVEVRPAGYNGKKYTYILREAKPGALKIEEGKYKSVRQLYKDNPDLIWWDTKGHNYGKEIYVTRQSDDAVNVMSNIRELPISKVIERYLPSYYVTKQKPIEQVIKYTYNPITGYTPSMPGKILTNRMSYDDILLQPVISSVKEITPTKTSLAFFERLPSKISEAERLGIPKGGHAPYTREENIAFRNQINEFANKYGYEPIGEEVTDPEVLERYARSMISKHNSFYRGVHMPYNEDDIAIIHKVLGASPTKELVLLYVATHPRSKLDPMFISPRSNAGIYGSNGKTAIISRPYKLGPDRTKWFTEGDYPIYLAPGLKQYQLPENVITDPWTTPSFPEKMPSVGGGYRYYDFDPTDKEFYDLVKHLYEVRPFDAPNELTTRSPMIFRGWANGELPDLSRNYGRHPWQEVVFRKQGGKLNYLDSNKNLKLLLKKK